MTVLHFCQVCEHLFHKLVKARFMATNDIIEWMECGSHGVMQNHLNVMRTQLVDLEQWFEEHFYYELTHQKKPNKKPKWHIVNTPRTPQFLTADMWQKKDGTGSG